MMGLEMHEAASLGDYDSLEDHINSGKYDINQRDPDWKNKTPLHWASGKGFAECVRVLLENGANGVSRMDMDWTPAHCAAESGKVGVLRTLNKAGISLTKEDAYGDTPLRVAQIYGHRDCINFIQMVEREVQDQQTIPDDRSSSATSSRSRKSLRSSAASIKSRRKESIVSDRDSDWVSENNKKNISHGASR